MPACTGCISPTGNGPSFSRSSHLLPARDDHALTTGGPSTPSSLSSSLSSARGAAGRSSRVHTARRRRHGGASSTGARWVGLWERIWRAALATRDRQGQLDWTIASECVWEYLGVTSTFSRCNENMRNSPPLAGGQVEEPTLEDQGQTSGITSLRMRAERQIVASGAGSFGTNCRVTSMHEQ